MNDFQFRRLRREDLVDLHRLYSDVSVESSGSVFFSNRTLQTFTENFDLGGVYIGAFLSGDLIGYSGVRFPSGSRPSISRAVGISSCVVPLMAEFDGSCVKRHCRGFGLQRDLSEIRAQVSIKHGRPFSLGVVAERNFFSLRNFLKFGMKVRGVLEKEDSSIWYVIIGDHSRIGPESYSDVLDLSVVDRVGLEEAFSVGYQVFGLDIVRGENIFKLGKDRFDYEACSSIEQFDRFARRRELCSV